MKKCLCFNKIKLVFTFLLGIALLNPPSALADSRSATVRISCTVVPMIEMVQDKTVNVRSNLGKQYLSSESWIDRGGQRVQLVSITAL